VVFHFLLRPPLLRQLLDRLWRLNLRVTSFCLALLQHRHLPKYRLVVVGLCLAHPHQRMPLHNHPLLGLHLLLLHPLRPRLERRMHPHQRRAFPLVHLLLRRLQPLGINKQQMIQRSRLIGERASKDAKSVATLAVTETAKRLMKEFRNSQARLVQDFPLVVQRKLPRHLALPLDSRHQRLLVAQRRLPPTAVRFSLAPHQVLPLVYPLPVRVAADRVSRLARQPRRRPLQLRCRTMVRPHPH
jgi:hypothetical protein